MSTFTEYRLESTAGDLVRRIDPGEPPPSAQDTPSTRPHVLIYRNDLIERSETFILAQAASMERYRGVFCGLAARPGGILPADAPRSLLAGNQRARAVQALVQKRAFMAAGFAPGWMRRCRQFSPVLIHAHFGVDAAFALPLQRTLGVPLVVSLHGYDVTSAQDALRSTAGGRLYLRRRQQLFSRADTFICVSRFIRDQAVERGYPAEKLWVHSIGIDLKAFQADASEKREPVVLFVGRLVEKKGCAHLITAMRAVQTALPTARLVVIGDGPLRPALQHHAATMLPGRYEFMGAQPSSVVRNCMREAMVFSVPSVTAANGDREGLGMVFCEAQAMGVPVASFASGGIPEVVIDGVTGYLTAERDTVGLARNICKLLKDRVRWAEMSYQGQSLMRRSFNLATQTDLLEAKYDEVAAVASRVRQELLPA